MSWEAHSYEEIRGIAIDILAGRITVTGNMRQLGDLTRGVASVFVDRGENDPNQRGVSLSPEEESIVQEVFWELFRQGIITPGSDGAGFNLPFFRVSRFGKSMLDGSEVYFFHDLATYEVQIKSEVPAIDDVTLMYAKEAMQAFRSGCLLSSTVMIGVASEHVFLKMMEEIDQSTTWRSVFSAVSGERTILRKTNKFKAILNNHLSALTSTAKENLDTNLSTLQTLIRNFRNETGHPTGKIIPREQVYVLLNVFILYCKKIHQLRVELR